MKVFLTGATGFVGAHTALALLAAGHELRLLVRNAQMARSYFANHGYRVDDLIVADMCDAQAIRRGMDGCDAVLHAAASVSLDRNKADATYRNNVAGMKAVVGGACDQGIGNIVHVSSVSVLFQPGVNIIDESTPLAAAREAYVRSKRDSDRYVRGLQQQGYPVQMTYPSAIIGPDDPRLSEANFAITQFLSAALPRTSSGFQCVDVRDLARVHRYLLEHAPKPPFEDARYIVGGHYQRWTDLYHLLVSLTGRRMFSPRVPGTLFRVLGAFMDLLRHIVPLQNPITAEAMIYITRWNEADSSRIQRYAGIDFRPAAETLTDTIRWLAQAGHLNRKYAGRLA